MPKIPDSYAASSRAVVVGQRPLQARLLQHSGGMDVGGGHLNPRIGAHNPIQLDAPIDRTDPTEIGRAVGALGETLFDTSLKMAEMDAVTEAKRGEIELRTKINEVMYERENALFTKSGKGFIDSVDAAKTEIDQYWNQIKDSMGDRAKSHFVLEGLETRNTAFASIAHSSVGHRRQYIEDTYEAYNAQALTEIGNSFRDPKRTVELINKYSDKIATEFPGPDGRLKQAKFQNQAFEALMNQAVVDEEFELADTYLQYGKDVVKLASEHPEEAIGLSIETLTKMEQTVISGMRAANDRAEVMENRAQENARESRTQAYLGAVRAFYTATPEKRALMEAGVKAQLATASTNPHSAAPNVDTLIDTLSSFNTINNQDGVDESSSVSAEYKANWETYAGRPYTYMKDPRLKPKDVEEIVSYMNTRKDAETKELEGQAKSTIVAALQVKGQFDDQDTAQNYALEKVMAIYRAKMQSGLEKLRASNVPEEAKPATIRALHSQVLSSVSEQFVPSIPASSNGEFLPALVNGWKFSEEEKANPEALQAKADAMTRAIIFSVDSGNMDREEGNAQLDILNLHIKTYSQGVSSGYLKNITKGKK